MMYVSDLLCLFEKFSLQVTLKSFASLIELYLLNVQIWFSDSN